MLANAEAEVSRVVMAGFEIARTIEGESCLRRWIQIGRTTHQPWIVPGDCVENFGRRIAGGEALGIGRKGGEFLVPTVGRLTMLHAFELRRQFGILLAVCAEQRVPLAA